MKKSKLTKALALIAVVALCASPLGISAETAQTETTYSDDGIMPMNIAITATDNSLTLGSYGKMTCFGSTDVQSGYKAGVIVELQQNNGGWTTIATWEKKGGYSATVEEDRYVDKGYSYRLKLTHKAYTSADVQVESFPKYSNVVDYN